MLARCGRAAHICEANRNCTMKENKNLRENHKESQLPLKLKGCNKSTRFQGQLRFPRQAGDVPQPCRTGFRWFSKKNISNYEPQATKKFFGAAVFQKCCRGVGEQPTFAKQIEFCNLFFCCNRFFENLQIRN